MIEDEKEKEAFVGENTDMIISIDNEYDSHYIM